MSHWTPDSTGDEASGTLDALTTALAELDFGHVLAFLAIAGVDLFLITKHVAGKPLPPNDTKHWLLRARYYAPGWHMPQSELVGQFATHPFAIVTLSVVLLLIGSAILAAKVWTILGFMFATVAVYVAARELASPRIALLAFAVAGFSHFYFILVAFGGIPNLIAVGFLTLAVGAMIRARRTERTRDRLLYTLLLGLGLFSHPPSSPVFVASIAVTAVVLGLVRRNGWIVVHTVVDSLLPSVLFLGYVLSQWTIFAEYTASPDGQGLDVILHLLTRNWPLFVGYAVAVAGVPVLLFVHALRRRYESDRPTPHSLLERETTPRLVGNRWLRDHETGLVVLAWLAGPTLLAITVAQVPQVQTKLIRVTFFLVAPLAVVMATSVVLAAPLLADYGRRVGFRIEAPGVDMHGAVLVLLALLVLVPTVQYTAGYSERSAHYYAPKNEGSLLAVVHWLQGRQPFEGAVAGPYNVAPWVKGLTGQSGLTATPGGGYRPDEAVKTKAYGRLTHLRDVGATPAAVAGARQTIQTYDVRYIVTQNDAKAGAYGAVGHPVFETKAYVVYEVDRSGSGGSSSVGSGDS